MMKVSVTLQTAEIKIGVEKNNIDIINYVWVKAKWKHGLWVFNMCNDVRAESKCVQYV